MLLVYSVLQHTTALYCLFTLSCNIQRLYVACLTCLATFEAPTLLVTPHLQHSRLQHCLSRPTCNIRPLSITTHPLYTSFQYDKRWDISLVPAFSIYIPFCCMTCLYQSNDFFFRRSSEPLPASSLST